MSLTTRCIGTPLRALSSSNVRITMGYARSAILGPRRYAHALRQESEPGLRSEELVSRRTERAESWQSVTQVSSESDGWTKDPRFRKPTDMRLEEYFKRLFSPLQFPPELAQRILTHSSHRAGMNGHNGGFSFLGRRVMASYFMMFLHASPKLNPTDDIEDIAARSLNTNLLGEYVGNEWGVGRELVWAPAAPMRAFQEEGPLPGLYKVQGETVQAIIGAIYHQFGGSVAHRVFHTRLLPLLLVKGGLPRQFHSEVRSICERMGGSEGPLLFETANKTSKVEA